MKFTIKVAVYAPAERVDKLTLFHLYQYMYSVIVTKKIPVYDPNTLVYYLQFQVSVYHGVQTLLAKKRISQYRTGLHSRYSILDRLFFMERILYVDWDVT